jgi:hypothetical protein
MRERSGKVLTLQRSCTGQETGGKGKKKAMSLTSAQEESLYIVTGCLRVLTVNAACAFRLARSGCVDVLVKTLQCSNLVSRRAARTILGMLTNNIVESASYSMASTNHDIRQLSSSTDTRAVTCIRFSVNANMLRS